MTDMQTPQPHPFLVDPVLYITGVPLSVADTELAQAFGPCLPVRLQITRDGMGVDEGGHGTVEFKLFEAGEPLSLHIST